MSEGAKREGVERGDVRFTRRDVRDFTRWGDTQLKVHLKRLEELEYLLVHAGGARRRMVYELAVGRESHAYDANWSGGEGHWSGSGRGLVGAAKRPDLASDSETKRELVGASVHTHPSLRANGTSYASASQAKRAASAP